MIAQHARLARTLAEQLGLPAGYPRGDRRRVRAVGRARLAGRAEGEAVPRRCQDRPARRVHGGGAPRTRRRRRAGAGALAVGQAVRPGPGGVAIRGGGRRSSPASTRFPPWQAVIAAEPALAVDLSPAELDGALTADRELRRPEVTVHPRPLGRGRGAGRSRPGARLGLPAREDGTAAPGRAGPRLRSAWRVEFDLGPPRAAQRRRMGTRTDVPLPDRAHAASVGGARAARRDRGTAPRAARRQRATRVGFPAARSPRLARVLGAADAYQAMREPRPHRPARPAQDATARTARRGHAQAASTAPPSTPSSTRPAIGVPRRRTAVAGLTAREVEVLHPARPRACRTSRSRPAGDLAEDRGQPRRAHLRQDRHLKPGVRGDVRPAARPAPREEIAVPAR